ncbi:transposase [Nocardia sp. KC 131]|uniref:transposase n=1 Tax=Nocardia arseniciresistens TaxID=3392119 RepID=UPI00398E6124
MPVSLTCSCSSCPAHGKSPAGSPKYPFYLVRGGIAWMQLPHDFPPAKTVYDIYRGWAKAGAWQRIRDMLRDRVRVRAGRNPQPSAAVIDSQTVRGADTVATGITGYDAAEKTKGRKRHIATDTTGLLLPVVVTAACIQDRDAAHRLLAAVCARFATITLVFADGGYAGRLVFGRNPLLRQRFRSSGAATPPPGSRYCPAAGLSNEHLGG